MNLSPLQMVWVDDEIGEIDEIDREREAFEEAPRLDTTDVFYESR